MVRKRNKPVLNQGTLWDELDDSTVAESFNKALTNTPTDFSPKVPILNPATSSPTLSSTFGLTQKEKNRIYQQRSYWKKKIKDTLVDERTAKMFTDRIVAATKDEQFEAFKDYFKSLRDINKPGQPSETVKEATHLMRESMKKLRIGANDFDNITLIKEIEQENENEYERIISEEPSPRVIEALMKQYSKYGVESALNLSRVISAVA